MSGGGGGGSSKPKVDTPTTAPMQTVQPGMPGQISTLADQLSAGFGQHPSDIMAQLQQYYQPMSIPNYAPVTPAAPTPAAPKPVVVTPPKTRTPNPSSGGYVVHGGGANR